MALKNTAPFAPSFSAKFNLVTKTGISALKSLPFGGAVGLVAAGALLWLVPRVVPAGWSAEAVLSLGMGAGFVMHKLVDGLMGWFFDPVGRHLRSRWDAWLQLTKLARYERDGLITPEEASALKEKIARSDVSPRRSR